MTRCAPTPGRAAGDPDARMSPCGALCESPHHRRPSKTQPTTSAVKISSRGSPRSTRRSRRAAARFRASAGRGRWRATTTMNGTISVEVDHLREATDDRLIGRECEAESEEGDDRGEAADRSLRASANERERDEHSVTAMIGPIDIAGDGAPSHDTTAAIASKPGRGLTKSDASSGIGINGSTRACARWCWRAPRASPCPSRGAAPGVQRPDEDARPDQANDQRRDRYPPGRSGGADQLGTAPPADGGGAEHDEQRQHREWFEWDVEVVHRQAGDADEPGREARGHRQALPRSASWREQRRQRESREQGSSHHPGEGLREVVQWQAGSSSAALEGGHCKHRARDDQQVECDRLTLDVVQVVRELDVDPSTPLP